MERRTVSRREEGVELVRATFSVDEAAQSALGDLLRSAESFVDRELLPRAKEAYARDPDPDKRFAFRRFTYAFSASAAPADDGESELVLSATLARAGGEILEKTEQRLRLSAEDGGFLPPKKKRRPKTPSPPLTRENQ